MTIIFAFVAGGNFEKKDWILFLIACLGIIAGIIGLFIYKN